MKRVIGGAVGALFILMSFTPGKPAHNDENFRQEFLARINAVRKQGCNCGNTYMPPADPVVWNENLGLSAYAHARDMAANRYFSHYSLDGRKLKDRTLSAGYNFAGYRSYLIGENIAQGQRTIKEVMRDWFNSPGHCKNLMNPGFKEVGIAVENLYWVQDFGGRETKEVVYVSK